VYVTHDQKEALSMGTDISIMHAGNLIQTDSPRGLYNNPNTPFIAGFIGETNFIEGTVKSVDAAKNHWVVDTPHGEITSARAAVNVSAGAKVALSVRPEAVQVSWKGASQSDATNKLSLKLEHLTYLGESEQFFLKGADGKGIKANLYHSPNHSFGEGDTVPCVLDPEDVLVLPPQKDMGPGT